jgi:hypothetical protein
MPPEGNYLQCVQIISLLLLVSLGVGAQTHAERRTHNNNIINTLSIIFRLKFVMMIIKQFLFLVSSFYFVSGQIFRLQQVSINDDPIQIQANNGHVQLTFQPNDEIELRFSGNAVDAWWEIRGMLENPLPVLWVDFYVRDAWAVPQHQWVNRPFVGEMGPAEIGGHVGLEAVPGMVGLSGLVHRTFRRVHRADLNRDFRSSVKFSLTPGRFIPDQVPMLLGVQLDAIIKFRDGQVERRSAVSFFRDFTFIYAPDESDDDDFVPPPPIGDAYQTPPQSPRPIPRVPPPIHNRHPPAGDHNDFDLRTP